MKDLREILEQQKYRCALTGEKLTPQNATFDHIVAMANGGSCLKENLQAVTRQANMAKGTLGNKEFLDLCKKIVSLSSKIKYKN
jgi:5-methylcytosine-specific restriction endonuclease McrA